MSCGPFRVVRRTFSYVDIRIVEKENTKLSLAVLFQPNCGKHYFFLLFRQPFQLRISCCGICKD